MENQNQRIDFFISELNKKDFVSAIVVKNLEYLELSSKEKEFIKEFQPERKLIIYGTLAPGKPNYSKIEHIKGDWEDGIVKGILENKGWGADLGFFGFRHATKSEQIPIEVKVLFSDDLSINWLYLDTFEGDGYKRILAKYRLKNCLMGVGYIYALNT